MRRAPQSGKTKGTIVASMTAIYRQEGLRAFWNGNGANTLKIMPESAMRFLGYEVFKNAVCQVSVFTSFFHFFFHFFCTFCTFFLLFFSSSVDPCILVSTTKVSISSLKLEPWRRVESEGVVFVFKLN